MVMMDPPYGAVDGFTSWRKIDDLSIERHWIILIGALRKNEDADKDGTTVFQPSPLTTSNHWQMCTGLNVCWTLVYPFDVCQLLLAGDFTTHKLSVSQTFRFQLTKWTKVCLRDSLFSKAPTTFSTLHRLSLLSTLSAFAHCCGLWSMQWLLLKHPFISVASQELH